MARKKILISRDSTQVVEITAEEEAVLAAQKTVREAKEPARIAKEIQSNRRAAYRAEADPLFFEEQRSEIRAGTHAAKVAEIKARFPK